MVNMNIHTVEETKLYTQKFESDDQVQSLISTQTSLVEKNNLRLEQSIKNLYLCHATNFFPNKGMIYPRITSKFNIPSSNLKMVTEETFAITRPTVHFSINSIVTEHKKYVEENNHRFIVIDKFENALDKICGGYLEDVFCIGPYRLSHKATILAPESCKTTLQEKIKGMSKKIKITYYSGSEKEGLNQWLHIHHASYTISEI